MNAVFSFLNDQILKMQWLSDIVKSLLKLFGLQEGTAVFGSVHFFIYDVIKIFILLSVLIGLISYIQSYFPPERTRKMLTRVKGIGGNILGALMGTLTPFCACSSIPIFMGFTQAGLPLGVTFSFLISSPLIDLGAFILLISVFNLKIALAYMLVGVTLAVIGGSLITRLKMDDQVEDYIRQTQARDADAPELTRKDRRSFAFSQVKSIVRRVWPYILIGVGIGALIHNWIPQSVIEAVVGSQNPFAPILATLMGAPMYADIFGTIPVAEALFLKGVGIGTVLAFMMAVTTLSVPSLVMLRKVVKPKLLWTFIIIVVIGIILIGYLFNAIAGLLI